ncbi:bifunctional diaminohydroxyphosphoribosylaminopyrimidine deaminase/5-amino-6-(5-phosphoribosylamino)uracil reductase RibD [uncultured Enterovirga sp.]|uniref:bifunctional diaminohydroxyphosphoribosylaminopyrimidine deaminase/5-amino-6-(5-phosphoribosylamino)uracil reductase RibD n=1 Tax=uncultured Enterovirga sp. TaxID=2026352 RepID=UPI0035CA91FC
MSRAEIDAEDRRLIAAAIALGSRHNGLTWPNPSVGAILARTGEDGGACILAQGVTARGGRPHAEPAAIAAAGPAARDATLYVSLEPCSHHGRTPPCVEAIVAAGIRRVVSAVEDPDPRVAGRGHAILRQAGIAVTTGIGGAEAERAHRGHLTRIRLGRPAITLKLARTADGYAAGAEGEPRLMISGEGAGARTHLLRAHADAVLIGVSTALADDPRLDVRLPGLEDRSPVRIVLDSRLRLPQDGKLARGARERPTWVVCGPDAEPAAERRLTECGVGVIRMPEGGSASLDLRAVMTSLAARGLTRILCEGGPTLAEALAEADLVDEAVLVTNARARGRAGLPAIGTALARRLALDMRPVRTDIAGDDTIDHFERAACSPVS